MEGGGLWSISCNREVRCRGGSSQPHRDSCSWEQCWAPATSFHGATESLPQAGKAGGLNDQRPPKPAEAHTEHIQPEHQHLSPPCPPCPARLRVFQDRQSWLGESSREGRGRQEAQSMTRRPENSQMGSGARMRGAGGGKRGRGPEDKWK